MIIADFEYRYYTDPSQSGTFAKVFLVLKDSVTGETASSYGLPIYYEQNINGAISQHNTIMRGQRMPIYEGKYRDYDFYASWRIITQAADDEQVPIPVNFCDLKVSFVKVDKPETAPGSNDAKITVSASSSYAIEYSINGGASWQASPVFNNLSGGYFLVQVRDSNPLGCQKETSVTIPTVRSLLVNNPGVNIGSGNISRWNAAFNPIVFTYQRRDFEVVSVTGTAVTGKGTLARLQVNGDVSTAPAGELIYVNAGVYKGIFSIISIGSGVLIIDTPFISNQSGFVNINSLRPYYKILTKITSTHPETGITQTITSVNRPDETGLVKADMSHFLQSLLQVTDTSDYTQINYRDSNLSASYQLAYAPVWDGKLKEGESPEYIAMAEPYYVLYAAKQLGEQYGGNMAAHVPFKTVLQPAQGAKWLTDFAEPAYSNNYPFDLGFIYSEDLLGLQLYAEIIMLDINRQPLAGGQQNVYLLNEDGSWLLNQDDSKLLISRQTAGVNPLPEKLGLNRLLINYDFPAGAWYFTVALKYNDTEEITHTVTQTQTVRIDKAIDDNSVYLRWIGLNGAWNYYRFVYNQDVSLDVQNAVVIKNYVTDWENQQGIEEVISKNAGQKIKVMAEDLSVADIKGLQSIKYSPKVQLLVNTNPVKWQTVVINTATYNEYETRNGQAPFSITFNLPAVNVQAQ